MMRFLYEEGMEFLCTQLTARHVPCFHKSIGIEDEPVTGVYLYSFLFVFYVGEGTDNGAVCRKSVDVAVFSKQYRMVMGRVGITDFVTVHVNYSQKGGKIFVNTTGCGSNIVVNPVHHLVAADVCYGVSVEGEFCHGHDKGGRDAMPAYIGHNDAYVTGININDIVVIAAKFLHGLVAAAEADALMVGEFTGHNGSLNMLSHLKFPAHGAIGVCQFPVKRSQPPLLNGKYPSQNGREEGQEKEKEISYYKFINMAFDTAIKNGHVIDSDDYEMAYGLFQKGKTQFKEGNKSGIEKEGQKEMAFNAAGIMDQHGEKSET